MNEDKLHYIADFAVSCAKNKRDNRILCEAILVKSIRIKLILQGFLADVILWSNSNKLKLSMN